MTISQLQRIRTGSLDGNDGPRALPRIGGDAQGVSFSDTLQQAIEEVDASQKAADGQLQAFVSGEQENVHDVMIAMNQARLSFQLMTEVRNKMLETYQELMRMQV